jgi:dTDP-4-dehydrorhamnose 3,5-epimerase
VNIRALHPFADVFVVQPPGFADERGHFREVFHKGKLREAGLSLDLVQLNHSFSRRGVLRGMHFQQPHPQGKLIAVTSGVVFDVAIDVRVDSPTFGRWASQELTADRGEQLYVPQGFAHGFLVLSDGADVVYGCTAPYRSDAEHVLAWNDAGVSVAWPLAAAPVMAARDRQGLSLSALREAGALPLYTP